MPYLADMIVDAVLVFFYDDCVKMMGEVNIPFFHFVRVGIVLFLSTTDSAGANGVLSEGMVKHLRVATLEIPSNRGRPVHVCL